MDSNEQNRINRIEEFLLDPEKTIFNSIEEFTEAAKILVDFLNNVNFEQLDTIQGEDGYTPVRGVDYFTPEDITAFETFLIERIPVEGVDYPTVQEVQDYISSQVAKIPRIKGDKGAKGEKGQDGKNGSPDTGEDIIKKIRETKKDKLKIGDVRGLTPKISLLNETVDELDNVKKYVEGLKVIIPHVDQSPAGLVTTVNGKTGNVVLDHTDVGADVSGAAAQALSDAKAYTDGKDLLNAEKWRNIPLDAGFSSPSNNDIPIYDDVSGSWKLGQQSGGGAWGSITGTLSDQTDLDTALSGKENTSNKKTDLSSPDNTSYPTTKAVADAIQNSGGGDMLKSTYDPQNKSEAVAFASELPVDVSELNNDAGYTTNTGTVTSVGVSVPTGFSVSGSPVTSSGTLAITYASGYQGYTTLEAGKLSGIETNADVTDATNVAAAGAVMTSGNQSIGGVKSFTSFPVTPSSAPSTDYQTANKKYVDDSLDLFTISLNFIDEQTVTIKAPFDMRIVTFTAEAGTPTIEVNGSPYTLNTDIDQFDEIEVDAGAVDRLVNLNCIKI